MSCEPYREMLIDHIADELTEEERILIEQHLAECDDCTSEEHQLRRAIEATAPAEIGEVGPEMEARLVVAFRERAASPATGHLKPANGRRKRNLRQGFLRSLFAGLDLRRAIPAYVALPLFVAAVATGFWAGGAERTDSLTRGSRVPTRPATHQPSRDTQAPGDALAIIGIDSHDSLNRVSGSLSREPSAARFATTPSDAIWMGRAGPRDTL